MGKADEHAEWLSRYTEEILGLVLPEKKITLPEMRSIMRRALVDMWHHAQKHAGECRGWSANRTSDHNHDIDAGCKHDMGKTRSESPACRQTWQGDNREFEGEMMPKKVHDKLEREAEKKGLKGERKDAYVYGTLDKIEKKRKRRGK